MSKPSQTAKDQIGDRPRIREIRKVIDNSPSVKTFRIRDPQSKETNPGQFILLWVPGAGEIPLSPSAVEAPLVELTVKKVGEVTGKLHRLRQGNRVGIRGPYGNGFSAPSEGVGHLVAGGCGVPPIRHYYRSFEENSHLKVFLGAETEAELLFREELSPCQVATDDGSAGQEGTIVEPLKDQLRRHSGSKWVLAAGPERMSWKVFNICEELGIDLEVSLERIMKCGIGLCGSCLMDGFRVCKEGPVADRERLRGIDEFGQWKRDQTGRREEL